MQMYGTVSHGVLAFLTRDFGGASVRFVTTLAILMNLIQGLSTQWQP